MCATQASSDEHAVAAMSSPNINRCGALRVTVDRPTHDAAVLNVTGPVDTSTATRLHELLHHRLTACVQVVVLDLSGVTFFNTTGLDLLQQSQQHAEQREISLRIVGDNEGKVKRLLGILDLTHRFLLYTSTAQALATTSHALLHQRGNPAAAGRPR